MEETSLSLEELVREAPQPVRDYLASGGFKSTITTIAASAGLSENISAALAREVLFVLVGAITPLELPEQLSEAGIPEDKKVEILTRVQESVFVPLQSKLGQRVPTSSPVKNVPTPAQPAPTHPSDIPVPPTQPLSSSKPPQPKPVTPTSYTNDPYREPLT